MREVSLEVFHMPYYRPTSQVLVTSLNCISRLPNLKEIWATR